MAPPIDAERGVLYRVGASYVTGESVIRTHRWSITAEEEEDWGPVLKEIEKPHPQPKPESGTPNPTREVGAVAVNYADRAPLIIISRSGVTFMARPTVLSPQGEKIYCPNLHFIVHNRIKMMDSPARLTASFHSYSSL